MERSLRKQQISIITVVFNDRTGLEKTINGIVSQTSQNIEFIIIDGGSNDGTVDIIKKYKDKVNYWVSEKDKGIYDAMNKGIKASSGNWLNFMNAGDTFVDNKVLDEINFEKYCNDALIYGNKIQDKKVVKPFDIDILKKGIIMGNHQSMFFNKEILKNDLLYDLSYPIYADYELVNKIYTKNYSIKFINKNIANYEGGGISSLVSTQKRKDKYKIVFKYYGVIGLINSIFSKIISTFIR